MWEKVAPEGGRMRGRKGREDQRGGMKAGGRPVDPSSVSSADTFSRKGRRTLDGVQELNP